MNTNKFPGQLRNKMKYDSYNSLVGVDSYEPRHDIRSPGIRHHHHHHSANNSLNGPNSLGNVSQGHQTHDQMNAMMNMLNPMMAAFIQQLANGIQPPIPNIGMENGHSHILPVWQSNDYSRNNSSGSQYTPSGYSNSETAHTQYKREKHF